MATTISSNPRRGRPPKKALSTTDEDKNTKEVYNVEKILGKKKIKGTWKYLVKWEGYSDKECTWEPFQNLGNFTELVKQYYAERKQKKISKEDEDYAKKSPDPEVIEEDITKEDEGEEEGEEDKPMKKIKTDLVLDPYLEQESVPQTPLNDSHSPYDDQSEEIVDTKQQKKVSKKDQGYAKKSPKVIKEDITKKDEEKEEKPIKKIKKDLALTPSLNDSPCEDQPEEIVDTKQQKTPEKDKDYAKHSPEVIEEDISKEDVEEEEKSITEIKKDLPSTPCLDQKSVPRTLPKHGHFQHGDQPKKIVDIKRENDLIVFAIEWKARENGQIPLDTIMTNLELREYDKDLLLDFYEPSLPRYGHFKYGDRPEKIVDAKREKDLVLFTVEWKARENGEIPLNTIMTNLELKRYETKDLLLDFYESKIIFVHSSKEINPPTSSFNTNDTRDKSNEGHGVRQEDEFEAKGSMNANSDKKSNDTTSNEEDGQLLENDNLRKILNI